MCRASAYELLSLAFLTPVEPTAEALVAGEFADSCKEVFSGIGFDTKDGKAFDSATTSAIEALRSYEGQDAEEIFHEVRREYTRLFLPVGTRDSLVTPFVGIWRAQERGQKGVLFIGAESIAIEHFLRRCGVAKDIKAGQTNDPVDHIGTICEFLSYLCLVEAEAVKPADSANVQDDDYETFLCEHFRGYALWFADSLCELSTNTFYESMAQLLIALVQK
jgi:TorA maturation chaperone TorD